MANLVLTTECQRKCPYCFAKDDQNKKLSFSWDSFVKAIDFISTGSKIINLLGGEPTLHPEFMRMLKYLISNDFTVQVFTNGMLSDDILTKLVNFINENTLEKDQLYFAVNINAKKHRSKEETLKQSKFLNSINSLAYPSFTIYEKDTNLLFLVDLVNKYNLDPTIKLGLAMPVINGSNTFLPLKNYRNVAENIMNLSDNSNGITITLDCGFPLCMFTLDEIYKLNENKENDFMFLCGQPLDIHPDLNVTNCYPLSKLHKINIDKFETFDELNNYFKDGFVTPSGVFNTKCKECAFFRKICSGGCKGFYTPQNTGGDDVR